MQTGEMIKHGDTYYWYQPTLGEYRVRRANWKSMYLWAVATFGDPNLFATIPPRKWYAAEQQFNFLNAEDRMYMIMRWE